MSYDTPPENIAEHYESHITPCLRYAAIRHYCELPIEGSQPRYGYGHADDRHTSLLSQTTAGCRHSHKSFL